VKSIDAALPSTGGKTEASLTKIVTSAASITSCVNDVPACVVPPVVKLKVN